MFHYVFFNAPLLFFLILSFTTNLPYGQLVTQQKYLRQKYQTYFFFFVHHITPPNKHPNPSIPQNTTARLCKPKILPKLSGKKLHESISNDLEFDIRCSHSQKPQIPDQPRACTFSSIQACVCLPLLILFFCLLSGTSPLNALLSRHPAVSLQTSPSGTHTPHLQKTLNVRLSLVLK